MPTPTEDGRLVKEARLAMGLSQTEMAKAVGTATLRAYTKWEDGTNKPSGAGKKNVYLLLQLHNLVSRDVFLNLVMGRTLGGP